MSRRGFVLLYVLPVVCVRGLQELFAFMPDLRLSLWALLAAGVISSVLLVIGFAKRLHDCGHSGLWSLLFLVPIFGWIAVVLMCAREGTPGPNRAGRAPLEFADSRW